MKKRWMKTVIETSKQDLPVLPYQRSARHAPASSRKAKTA